MMTDLGKKCSFPEIAQPATSEPKDVIEYPSARIQKKIGDFKFGDTFTASVKFRVRRVTEGKDYGSAEPRHEIELELISMDTIKPSKKGLPQHG